MFFNLLKTCPYHFTKDNIEEIMCDAPRDEHELLDYKSLNNIIRVIFVIIKLTLVWIATKK